MRMGGWERARGCAAVGKGCSFRGPKRTKRVYRPEIS